jgi:hypothetical protein
MIYTNIGTILAEISSIYSYLGVNYAKKVYKYWFWTYSYNTFWHNLHQYWHNLVEITSFDTNPGVNYSKKSL